MYQQACRDQRLSLGQSDRSLGCHEIRHKACRSVAGSSYLEYQNFWQKERQLGQTTAFNKETRQRRQNYSVRGAYHVPHRVLLILLNEDFQVLMSRRDLHRD